jgi:2-isopropylmalate synthase
LIIVLTTTPQAKTASLGNINLPPLLVELYDTTLRDLLHCQGDHLRPDNKLKIIYKLLDLGVEFVEAGFPQTASDEFKFNFFCSLQKDPRVREQLVPIGLKSKPEVPPKWDPGLAAILACETKFVTLVGKTSAALANTVFQLIPRKTWSKSNLQSSF